LSARKALSHQNNVAILFNKEYVMAKFKNARRRTSCLSTS
jgi:hypothetical protein